MISEAVKTIREAETTAADMIAASKAEIAALLAGAHNEGKDLCAKAEEEAEAIRADARTHACEKAEQTIREAEKNARAEAKELLAAAAGRKEDAVRLICEGVRAQWQ